MLAAGDAGADEAAAFALAQKAVSLKEDDPEAQALLGTLLERRGEFEQAAAHLERSIALNGRDPAPHFRLARVYLRLGRKEEAQKQRELHEKLSQDEKASGEPRAIIEP
jgi:Flp pilus assembly protein TadD